MRKLTTMTLVLTALALSPASYAGNCDNLPSWQQLKKTLTQARMESNGGFNLDMWASVVSTDGTVCAVAYTGENYGDQWLGSRLISAQKANTANAFSLPGLALSTANLYSPTQPGGSLYGLQHSNPVDSRVGYAGSAADFGTAKDPLVGKRLGGVNVFGGGLALYNAQGQRVGALGVSGDSSCADHNIAWKTRHALELDYVPAGVSPANDDNILFLAAEEKPNGFKHPLCGGTEDKVERAAVRKK